MYGPQRSTPSLWTSNMGTNYYWLTEDAKCPHCGHVEPDKIRHIGKSSAGWCFSLHVDETIKSLDDWIKQFKTGYIEDEYGEKVTVEEMIEIITNRKWEHRYYINETEFHLKNQSERGPNNLLRNKIGPHCIGHGPGTWDLITGDFS